MKKILILTLILTLIFPVVCSSQTMGDILSYVAEGSGFDQQTRQDTIIVTVAKLLQIFFTLLGTIFLIIIIYAGFMWMIAGGDEERITKAKKLIFNGIIGLAIILAAYSITWFVTAALTYSNVKQYPN